MDEMRIAIQSDTTIEYDDGSLKLSVCSHNAYIDGNKKLKNGVAYVGLTLCDPKIDDMEAALSKARMLIESVESQKPKVVDLSEFYRTASQSELDKVGGEMWSRIATKSAVSQSAPRDNPESFDNLKTLKEAKDYLSSKKVNGVARLKPDGNIDGGSVLVGVYGTDKAIVEIGVSGKAAYGGENLTAVQKNAILYEVGMNMRLREAP